MRQGQEAAAASPALREVQTEAKTIGKRPSLCKIVPFVTPFHSFNPSYFWRWWCAFRMVQTSFLPMRGWRGVPDRDTVCTGTKKSLQAHVKDKTTRIIIEYLAGWIGTVCLSTWKLRTNTCKYIKRAYQTLPPIFEEITKVLTVNNDSMTKRSFPSVSVSPPRLYSIISITD